MRATLDMFNPERKPPRAKPVLHEAAALHEVLLTLKTHPRVCWVERMNTGAMKVGSRFIRFGFPGCSDVLGQLWDGRLLAVEVKAPKGRLRPDQERFLTTVTEAGGVAFVARSLADVVRHLGPFRAASSSRPQQGVA